MSLKILVCVVTVASFALLGCGDKQNGAAVAGGDWVGEVYDTPHTKTSRLVGNFGSYDECAEAAREEAKSGVFTFNCGVQ